MLNKFSIHDRSTLILLTLMGFFSIEFLKYVVVGTIFTNYTFTCSKSTIDTLETGNK